MSLSRRRKNRLQSRRWRDYERKLSIAASGFFALWVAAACNDGPYAAKSESQVSREAHRRSVPHPKSDCSLPYRQSIFEGPQGCWADLPVAISISKTAEILSDANGPTCPVSRRSEPTASRKTASIAQA